VNTSHTIAVTGATGFLGGHITTRLLNEGCRVRILARDPQRAKSFEDRVAHIAYGDITNQDVLTRLFNACDTVVHLVSNFRVVKGPPESYQATNVAGTECALNAAEKAGVRRFVHCSTIGVHGDVKSTPATEETPFNPGDLYQETKLEAEFACRRKMQQSTMEIVIVRPTSQYGPGDMRMLKMFQMLAQGRFVLIGSCAANFHAVYIDDLVEGFWKVITTPGIAGEAFLIGGPGYVSLREYIDTAAEAVGAKRPRIRLPYWPVHAAAWACEGLCKPLGLEPPLHRRRVRFFKNNRAFSIDKARERLGYDPKIDLAEGMQRTVAWYREQGLL
jgi:nucleoside-diphosphate-sugar epimerase